MSFIIDNWMLIVVALASGGLLVWPSIAGSGGSGSLNAADAVVLMNREKAVVVDVSSPEEFATGHIAGSRNVPLDKLEADLPGTVKNKALPVILVCASGTRSRRALGIAKKLGYEKVQTLSGGVGAWRTANLPLEKA